MVKCGETWERGVLEHGISIQTQIILDHSIGYLLWHLFLRHLVLWQILSSESRAVHGGGEGVVRTGGSDVKSCHAFNEWLIDFVVSWDRC